MIRAVFVGASALALAACNTTTSFAPPPIAVQYADREAADLTCRPRSQKAVPILVTRDLKGTYKLIDGEWLIATFGS